MKRNLSGHKDVLIAVALGLMLTTCRDNSTGPPSNNAAKPGKRDYVWSIDSVDYGNLPSRIQLESIWGTSATDLWGAAGDAPDVRDCLWHYDGSRWSRATAGTPITEFTGNKVVYEIWGSAEADVWAVGRKVNQGVLSAFLMHFDGAHWIDATPVPVSSLETNLYNIYGMGQGNVWVGGYEYALHYDGREWSAYKLADSLTITSITGTNRAIFFSLSSPWGKQNVYLYQFQTVDSTFKIVDQTNLNQEKFGGRPWIVGHTFYSLENGIISTTISDAGQVDTAAWRRIFTTDTYFTQRYVESAEDMFAVGQYNLVYHYNGENWKQLFISVPHHTVDPHALFWGVWADGNEVTICDWQNGIVYHGR